MFAFAWLFKNMFLLDLVFVARRKLLYMRELPRWDLWIFGYYSVGEGVFMFAA